MDHKTFAFLHPDSYMVRRRNYRQGFYGQYHRSTSIHITNTDTVQITNALNANKLREVLCLPQSLDAKILPNTKETSVKAQEINQGLVTGDDNSVINSKTCEISSNYATNRLANLPLRTTELSSRETKLSYSKSSRPYWRSKDDREIQLESRCRRIARKLLPNMQLVETMKYCLTSLEEDNDSENICQQISLGSVNCVKRGVQYYIQNILKLQKYQRNDTEQWSSDFKTYNGLFQTQFSKIFEMDCNDALFSHLFWKNYIIDQNVPTPKTRNVPKNNLDESQKRPDVFCEYECLIDPDCEVGTLYRSTSETGVTHGPETLLRWLARCISVRRTYRQDLLKDARAKLSKLEENDQMVRKILKMANDLYPEIEESNVCYFDIPNNNCGDISYSIQNKNSEPNSNKSDVNKTLSFIFLNISSRFERHSKNQLSVLRLLFQLVRRLYELDCQIDRILKENSYVDLNETLDKNEINIENNRELTNTRLVLMQNRRDNIWFQVREAQLLRDDLEATREHLLTSIPNRFRVILPKFAQPNTHLISNNYASSNSFISKNSPKFVLPLDSEEFIFHTRFSSDPCDRRSPLLLDMQYDDINVTDQKIIENRDLSENILLAELLAKHLDVSLQTLLNVLIIETDISVDNAIINDIAEQLRLVSSCLA